MRGGRRGAHFLPKDFMGSSSDDLRSDLGAAYAALEGQKATQAFSTFTFEEALTAQMERIAGASTKMRPNELDRVTAIREKLLSAVSSAKALSADKFASEDAYSVNTEE